MTIPVGICQCGCGGVTSIAKKTHRAKGIVKGQPARYMIGHGNSRFIPCKTCGMSFRQKRQSTRISQFCSPECWSAFKPETRCVRCEINEIPKGWAKHCSQCRQDLNEANNHRQFVRYQLRHAFTRLAGKQCDECQERFIPRKLSQVFCSDLCRHRFHSRRQADLRRSRSASSEKRAISVDALGVRDGWRCHICQKKVTRSDASRDHLIPLSHGGTWDPQNLALAHHRCNSKRHAGRLPAQLRLVG